MCFSAPASFAAGAALLPAGIYCTRAAVRKDLRYIPLALVPLAFGVQQFGEGIVWTGLMRQDPQLVQQSSLFFLFFAIAFWPSWIPFSVLMVETRQWARRLLAALAIVGLAWLWLYLTAAVDPEQWLTTKVVKHSIRYEMGDVPGFLLLPRPVWRLGYVAVICVSLALTRFDTGGGRRASIFTGVLIAGLFVVSYSLYWHAFLSVWCFFAAVASLLLCRVFYTLPTVRPTSESTSPEPAAQTT